MNLKTIATSQNAWVRYARSFLFWNPLIVGVVWLLIGGFRLPLQDYLISLGISDIVSVFCIATFAAVRFARDVLRPGAKPFTRGQRAAISCAGMPPGLYAAFRLVDAFALGPPMSNTLSNYTMGAGFGAFIAAAMFLARERRENIRQARRAETESLRASVAALTAQMNPHFLFNALNTVASLIADDPARAELLVLRLAEVYRGVLEASRQLVHPLADEIRLCEAYLSVEKARFGERLRFDFDIPENLAAVPVPALSLQPLIENAVKHGLAPRAEGGHIRVRAVATGDGTEICVEDDGVGFGRSTHAGGAGAGLVNSRERLRLQDGGNGVEISAREGGGTRVLVKLRGVVA